MANDTEHLLAWADMGREEAIRLQAIPNIGDNEQEQTNSARVLDACGVEYIGSLTVVMTGPELYLFPYSKSPQQRRKSIDVDSSKLQLSGKFRGAQVFSHDQKGIDIGCQINWPIIDSIDDDHPDLPAIEFAIGPLATTNIWTPDDIFLGGLELPLEGVDAGSDEHTTEQERLSRVERFIDHVLQDDGVSVQNLKSIFTNPNLIRTDMEMAHFLRRLNNKMGSRELEFHVVTSQLYNPNPETGSFEPVLGPGAEVEVNFAPGARFMVYPGTTTARMLCLVSPVRKRDGMPLTLTVVDVEDTTRIKAIRTK